jgi:hypothetical protein
MQLKQICISKLSSSARGPEKGVFDMGKQKIRFINTSYETLFFVDDGGSIEIEIGNGWIRYPCRYIDEYHFKLENCVYHIYEFALLRERVAYRYRPAETQTEAEGKDFI